MENRLALVDPGEEITSKSILPVNTAAKMEVNSFASLEQAGDIVRILKGLQDEVDKVFKPLVEKAYATHKALTTERNKHLKPLIEAEEALRGKINLFLQAQEAARRKQELERAKAEENLKLQPAAQKPLFSASGLIAPPKLPEVSAPTKAAGMSTVQDWKWKVADLAAIPAEYWWLDEEKIDKEVRAKKGETKIAGIEVFSESRAVIRK